MSGKFQIILIGFMAANIFWIFYEKNYSRENTVKVTQHIAEPNKNDNAVGKQLAAGETVTNEGNNARKLSASKSQFKPVNQAMLELSGNSSLNDEPLAIENQKSKEALEKAISLWEQGELEYTPEDNSVEHQEPIKSNPEVLANLQVGQALDFFVPQLRETVQSVVTSTSNQYGDVKVWKGDIQGKELDKSNFIMTQGEKMTHVVLSTTEGIFTASIDNKTGKGTIIDDREYTSHISDTDDAVPYYYDNPQSEHPKDLNINNRPNEL